MTSEISVSDIARAEVGQWIWPGFPCIFSRLLIFHSVPVPISIVSGGRALSALFFASAHRLQAHVCQTAGRIDERLLNLHGCRPLYSMFSFRGIHHPRGIDIYSRLLLPHSSTPVTQLTTPTIACWWGRFRRECQCWGRQMWAMDFAGISLYFERGLRFPHYVQTDFKCLWWSARPRTIFPACTHIRSFCMSNGRPSGQAVPAMR